MGISSKLVPILIFFPDYLAVPKKSRIFVVVKRVI